RATRSPLSSRRTRSSVIRAPTNAASRSLSAKTDGGSPMRPMVSVVRGGAGGVETQAPISSARSNRSAPSAPRLLLQARTVYGPGQRRERGHVDDRSVGDRDA